MKKTKFQKGGILFISGCFVLVFSIVIAMTVKNTKDLESILKDSVKSQLISISIAARDMLDVDRFDSYHSRADVDADAEAYGKTLAALRSLQEEAGADYIYALKEIDGAYQFVFDTDTEDEEIFVEYELSPVHEKAFSGEEAADIMNVADEYGSFNTGAVPVWKDGKVIGIISADIADTYIAKSEKTSRTNAISLSVTMLVTMSVMIFLISMLLQRVWKMQDKLYRMANYDALTGLPNRQYLMDYLTELSTKAGKHQTPFALLFIDLDNFKKVNDNAGHDAGDELLRSIAAYLDGSVQGSTKAFRPTAGILNISARIGGDEFVQVVQGIGTVEEAKDIAEKVLKEFTLQPVNRFVEEYQVGLSIGVALYPYHTKDYNVLIKYADVAMYHAKKNGKNNYCVFSDGLKKV